MNKFLSICIPTYNGGKKLKKSLSYIIPIVSKYNVPIVISDNASEDNTYEIIEDIKKKYSSVFYFRNDENIGSDKNFIKVLNLATTKYAWLLGDDDYFTEEGFVQVLESAKSETDYSMITVNEKNRVFNVPTGDIIGGKNVINKLGAHLTWMSCLIFNRTEVKKIMNIERYYDSWFLQTGLVYDIMANDSKKLYWIQDHVIECCEEFTCAYLKEIFYTFTIRLNNVSNQFLDYYTKEDKKIFVESHRKFIPLNSFKMLLIRKFSKEYDLKFLCRYKKDIQLALGTSAFYKCLLTLCIPNLLIKMARKIYIGGKNFWKNHH